MDIFEDMRRRLGARAVELAAGSSIASIPLDSSFGMEVLQLAQIDAILGNNMTTYGICAFPDDTSGICSRPGSVGSDSDHGLTMRRLEQLQRALR